MSMTPSDWMNMTPSDWMNRTSSGWWNKSVGDLMNAKPADWWTMMSGSGSVAGTGPSTGTGATGSQSHHHHHHSCGGCHERHHHEGHHHKGPHHEHDCCRRCGSDPCQCQCCIGDVDFAVYSRVGEQRVIPIVVENERRREKQITLELSGWTTRSGKPAPVDTVLLEPKTFTLAACAEQKITLIVKIRSDDAANPNPNPNQDQPPERNPLSDVDDCLVATADIRLIGCDHRPIRVAVAILPRDCDPYEVSCGCTCC